MYKPHFYIYTEVPREYRPIYKRGQPLPLITTPPPAPSPTLWRHTTLHRHRQELFSAFLALFLLRYYVEGGEGFLLNHAPPPEYIPLGPTPNILFSIYLPIQLVDRRFLRVNFQLLLNKPTLKREYRPPCWIYSLGTKSPHKIISIPTFLAYNNKEYHE